MSDPNQPSSYSFDTSAAAHRPGSSGTSSKASMRLNLSNYNLAQSNSPATTITNQPTASHNPLSSTSQLDSSNLHRRNDSAITKSTDSIEPVDDSASKPINRNNSLISFKSLDFNLKTIYSSLKHKHRDQQGTARTQNSPVAGCGSSSTGGSKNDTTSSSKTSVSRTPYVRVETVDQDESHENLLLNYHSSPYSHRGSFDKTSSGSQYLTATGGQYPDYNSRSQVTTPSSFLTISSPPNVRRSSTSDICESKKTLTTSVSQPSQQCPETSRRPSTSDLLRRARERKSSGGPDVANKIGRSVSHGGMPRGGRGGRRTSMAF